MKTKHYVVEQKFGIPYRWQEVGRWVFEDGPERPNRFFDDATSFIKDPHATRLLVVEVEQLRGSGPDAWPLPPPPSQDSTYVPST